MSRRVISNGAALLATVLTISALAAGQVTERMSVNAAGEQGNNLTANGLSISQDGRFVVFCGWASNLVPNDTNGLSDVFVRDRFLGTTECVSVDSSGAMQSGGIYGAYFPSLSADGRYVAFESGCATLVAGDNNGRMDAFVHDRVTGVTERVSVDSSGNEQNGASVGDLYAAISADGRFVAFQSDATNLVPGDSNGFVDVFVYDRQTGITERVSVSSSGTEGNGRCGFPSVSGDGRFIAFVSDATNLLPHDANGLASDVLLRDRQSGTTIVISVSSSGVQANDSSAGASISDDGRFVTFSTDSTNVVDNDYNNADVFVHDLLNGTTEIVSVASRGVHGDRGSFIPSPAARAISSDGRYVAFHSDATNLVQGDANGMYDEFVHDRASGTTIRVSVDTAGHEGNDNSGPSALSNDGRFVAFASAATNLVAGDTNGVSDVFVHGPWLTLEADPSQVAAGATLTFTTWTGDSSNLVLLALVDIDGVPMFLPASISAFDAGGVWSLPVTVPPGLSGSALTLQTYGFVPTGKVQASNEVAVTFQ